MALIQYNTAVQHEAATASLIGSGVSTLSGISPARLNAVLSRVDAENDNWRATVAEPAIDSMSNGSPDETWVAIRSVVQARIGTQPSTAYLVLEIDSIQSELQVRSDALSSLRITAIGVGVGIELLAACLSLLFVRRDGLRVARDTQRRIQASSERIEIVASLRTLREQQTPEGTAEMIVAALHRLPGVDVAGVYAATAAGLLALAVKGMESFPVATGDIVPEAHARFLRTRSEHGAWAEEWRRPTAPTAYDEILHAIGIKGRAFAPIQIDGEFIGLIGLATTDEAHGRHLVDDLPAVGEFAAVAESILAPALVARRAVGEQRRKVITTIDASGFRPVFQPVVELATGLTVGFEALTRFEDGSRPDRVFAAAAGCGMGIELETVTPAALHDAQYLAPEAWLSVNVSPAFLAEGDTLVRMLADQTRPIVLEVAEHQAIASYAPLREAMRRLGPGCRLAVDDRAPESRTSITSSSSGRTSSRSTPAWSTGSTRTRAGGRWSWASCTSPSRPAARSWPKASRPSRTRDRGRARCHARPGLPAGHARCGRVLDRRGEVRFGRPSRCCQATRPPPRAARPGCPGGRPRRHARVGRVHVSSVAAP